MTQETGIVAIVNQEKISKTRTFDLARTYYTLFKPVVYSPAKVEYVRTNG